MSERWVWRDWDGSYFDGQIASDGEMSFRGAPLLDAKRFESKAAAIRAACGISGRPIKLIRKPRPVSAEDEKRIWNEAVEAVDSAIAVWQRSPADGSFVRNVVWSVRRP